MECCVCYEPLFINTNYCILSCNHNYHSTCLVKWSHINNSCPICKNKIYEKEKEKEKEESQTNEIIITEIFVVDARRTYNLIKKYKEFHFIVHNCISFIHLIISCYFIYSHQNFYLMHLLNTIYGYNIICYLILYTLYYQTYHHHTFQYNNTHSYYITVSLFDILSSFYLLIIYYYYNNFNSFIFLFISTICLLNIFIYSYLIYVFKIDLRGYHLT
jgi:hypothetical protein